MTVDLKPEPIKTTPIISPAEQLMLFDDTSKWLKVMEEEKPDMLYFLDKSARPLFWLLRDVYPNDSKLPEVRFLNIGEEKEDGFELVIEHSSFPELQASKKFHPKKVMIVDEKSHSGESLEKASRVVRKLYGLEGDQITTYSVLSAYPRWIRKAEMIGVTDPPDTQFNLLSQPVVDIEISPIEAMLVDRLKAAKVEPDKIEDQLVNISLPKDEKKGLVNRLKLMMDTKRKKSITINVELQDWESKRKRGDLPLRAEITHLACDFKRYFKKYDQFHQIEEEIRQSGMDREKLPEFLSLEWIQLEYIFKCDPQALIKLADKINTGDTDVSDGVYVYYLIKYNKLHPTDWSDVGNYYDAESPSLNYLSEKILEKL